MATARKASEPRQREVIPGLESVISPAFPPAVTFDALNVAQMIEVTSAKVVQARKYDDNSLRYWPDGSPMMILVIIGKDDKGEERSLWIQGARLNGAFRAALTHAGVDGIAPGDFVIVTWIGEEDVLDKKGKKLDTPAKLYDVELKV